MFKPAKARYNPRWEELRRQFRQMLRRNLTEREERLLELSQALLADNEANPAENVNQNAAISKLPVWPPAPPSPATVVPRKFKPKQ